MKVVVGVGNSPDGAKNKYIYLSTKKTFMSSKLEHFKNFLKFSHSF